MSKSVEPWKPWCDCTDPDCPTRAAMADRGRESRDPLLLRMTLRIERLVFERDRYRQALEDIDGVPLTERGFSEALNIARKALLTDK